MCKRELTEFLAELTEFAAELSEFSPPKQYSRNSIPPVPQKGCSRKCPLHFLHFNGAVCSNTLFSNTSALTNSLLFRANSTCKGSRTPRLVEHFWVSILEASFSNRHFVGTWRPSHHCRMMTIVGKYLRRPHNGV